MEGDAILAVPDGEALTAYVSTQSPHLLRDVQASFLGIDADSLQIVCPAVGGGFGGKIPIQVEYTLVLAAARRLARPLRWIQTRAENLTSMHARDAYFDVRLAATADGTITGVEVDTVSNLGAYPLTAAQLRVTTRNHVCGVYRVPCVEFRSRGVVTNTPPVGAFRGAGRPEGIFLIERAIDVLARRLGVDPVEVRRRNLIPPEDFPIGTVSGGFYDTGDYERCLDAALEIVGYDALRTEQASRRGTGSSWLGIGVCAYVEMSAAGANREFGSVEVLRSGRVRVLVGSSSHGQGHRTVFAQIAASMLGVPLEVVDVVQSDTRVVPDGVGTFGSRSAQLGGSAVRAGAEAVLAKARELAAHALEASPDDVVVVPGGGLAVAGVPAAALSWGELAAIADDPARRPAGVSPRLFADPGFEQVDTGTAPFGCHVAVVEVDAETGAVDLRRMVAVDDCGFVLNPMIAAGQVHGGLLAGIAESLFEELRYDADGNPINATFAEYLFPSAADVPRFEVGHTVTPTPNNPLGAKGLGEAGTTGSLAAIYNAVIDAVAHLGIDHVDLPLTPQRVWEAVNGRASAPDDAAR